MVIQNLPAQHVAHVQYGDGNGQYQCEEEHPELLLLHIPGTLAHRQRFVTRVRDRPEYLFLPGGGRVEFHPCPFRREIHPDGGNPVHAQERLLHAGHAVRTGHPLDVEDQGITRGGVSIACSVLINREWPFRIGCHQ